MTRTEAEAKARAAWEAARTPSREPRRIQIALAHILQAEVIVEAHMAEHTFAAFARAKVAKGLPWGCASETHARIRPWDVPVGSPIVNPVKK